MCVAVEPAVNVHLDPAVRKSTLSHKSWHLSDYKSSQLQCNWVIVQSCLAVWILASSHLTSVNSIGRVFVGSVNTNCLFVLYNIHIQQTIQILFELSVCLSSYLCLFLSCVFVTNECNYLQLIQISDGTLFAAVMHNNKHAFHYISLDRHNYSCSLSPKRHQLMLPTTRDYRNFFERLLFKDMN